MIEERQAAHRWTKAQEAAGAVFLAKFDRVSQLWGVRIHGFSPIGTGPTTWEAIVDLRKRSNIEER